MPENKSIYDIYLGAGKSTGEYQASLYGIEDVWSGIESAREKAKWKSEQTERTIDTISAGLELASQAYGGYKAKQEFEGYLGDVEGIKGPYEKVGAGGKAWGEMSMWERMWQTQEYKFGEEILGREDITIMAQMAKYGIDIPKGTGETITHEEFQTTGTSPGGKYEAVVGKGKEVDIGGGSMYEEELKVDAELEDPLNGVGELEMGAEKDVKFPILEQSGQYKAFNPLSYGEGEEDDDSLNYLKILESGGGH